MHNAATCPTCQANALTRNHYFTGKLMVERDFTDEQHYFRERLRLHNQRLHGSGVACGLAVTQHPNPACQSRYMLLEPGSAVDCCGNDILVTAEDTIDLWSYPAVKALIDHPDNTDHVLQVAICYRECPTEEIPVLYDDCACDDSQCAPNRILESYSIDVVLDPLTPAAVAGAPTLSYASTLLISAPLAVALDEAGGYVYVLTASTLYQLDASTQKLLTSVPLAAGQTGQALAISPDGKTLYVASAPASGDGSMSIYSAASLSTAPTTAQVTNAGNGIPFLAVTSQAQLVAAYPSNYVFAWNAGVKASKFLALATPATTKVTGLAVSSDGATAWIASDTATIQPLTLSATSITPAASFTVAGTGVELTVLAVLQSTAPDKLAAAGATNKTLYVIDPSTGTLLASASLAAPPIAMVGAPGGNWLYVDDANGAIEVIDIGRLLQNLPVTPPAPLQVGANTEGLVITASGQRLYVPYEGNASEGGVAVIDITNADCCAPLHEVRACPSCGGADCVVLATIRNYQGGYALLDPSDPPSNPTTDENNHIARINDLDGRKLLASTETLQEVIECLCANGGGGGTPGQQGPQGTQGPAGPGLTTECTRITALSWKHGAVNASPFVPITIAKTTYKALVMQFSDTVKITGGATDAYYRNVFQVEAPHATDAPYLCSCRINGRVIAVNVKAADITGGVITNATHSAKPGNGLAFLLPDTLRTVLGAELWVHLLGEFVVDSNGNAIAADFIRASLPSGDLRMASSPPPPPPPPVPLSTMLGIPGGRFDSWFTVQDTAIFNDANG